MPGEDVVHQRWRGDLAAEHDEDVGGRCLGHVAIGGQQQGIVVAAGVGVLGREGGVHVGAGDLARAGMALSLTRCHPDTVTRIPPVGR